MSTLRVFHSWIGLIGGVSLVLSACTDNASGLIYNPRNGEEIGSPKAGEDGQNTGAPTGGRSGAGGAGGAGFRSSDGGFNLNDLEGRLNPTGNDSQRGLICGSAVRTGASCTPSSVEFDGCLLPSFAGVCTCVRIAGRGFWACPMIGDAGSPPSCPQGVSSGRSCTSPGSLCMGGGKVICLCGFGSYTCF